MRFHAAQTVVSARPSQVNGDLIVVWHLHIPLPERDDELELDGQLYQLVDQLWPESGVMGAVLRFRHIAATAESA